MVMRARVSRNGQVSIPAEYRHEKNIESGDVVYWSKNEQGDLVLRAPSLTLEEMMGSLKPKRPGMTVDEAIEEARAAWAEEKAREFENL